MSTICHTEKKAKYSKLEGLNLNPNEIIAESNHKKLPQLTPKPLNKKSVDLAQNLLYPVPNNRNPKDICYPNNKNESYRHKSVGRNGAQKPKSHRRQVNLSQRDQMLLIEVQKNLSSIKEEETPDQGLSSGKDDTFKGSRPAQLPG